MPEKGSSSHSLNFLVNGTPGPVMCLDIQERKTCYHGDDYLPELHLSLVDSVCNYQIGHFCLML